MCRLFCTLCTHFVISSSSFLLNGQRYVVNCNDNDDDDHDDDDSMSGSRNKRKQLSARIHTIRIAHQEEYYLLLLLLLFGTTAAYIIVCNVSLSSNLHTQTFVLLPSTRLLLV